ncbi:MAG: ABC transporter substrate-binding protein [Sphingomonadaceae bacterium]
MLIRSTLPLRAAACLLLGAMAGCGVGDDPNRTEVSVIGALPRSADPDAEPLDHGRAFLARETAMGLVAFDANGQIEPALAESWIVTDDGLSIIFRLRRMTWPDGREVTGDDVAASLAKAMAPSSRNELKPLLTAIDAVIGMTGRVVEIRLKAPRPNLLQLFAQPELGIRRRGVGLGPWRIDQRRADRLVLRPVPDPALAADPDAPLDERQVTVRGGRAALAIARIADNRADLVLGGTFADWPVAQVAGLPPGATRVDIAEGLFGLAVIPRTPFLRDGQIRVALAMAIDRVALVSLFGAGRWKAADRLLQGQLDSGQPPATPLWVNNTAIERLAIARGRITQWARANGPIAPLRIALPNGPGSRLLFARIAADWRAIGISTRRVDAGARDADLRLIDAVAPNASANWYLTRTGCAAGLTCSPAGDAALVAARTATTLGERAAAIARADAAYAETQGFIPLAKPLRWSLVAPRLNGFRENAFAVHPLQRLRREAAN